MIDSQVHELPFSAVNHIKRLLTVNAARNLIRFAITGFITLVLSISASGSWVNWPNVIPLFGALVIVLIATHVFDMWRRPVDNRRLLVARLCYLVGIAGASIFFILDRHSSVFGHFTGM